MSNVETTSQNLLGRLRQRAIIERGVAATAVSGVVTMERDEETTSGGGGTSPEIIDEIEQRRFTRPSHIIPGSDLYLG